MGRTEIRLGSTVSFDSEKEKDLIDLINRASRQHKLGELVTHLLRIYSEKPENLLKKEEDISKLIIEMSNLGLTPERYKYFDTVSRQIEDMKCKVDKIYDMCLEIHTSAKFGKRLGLEGKSRNMLITEFILEKQLVDLSNELGIDNVRHIFNSNKMESVENKSDDILEYIIESYGNIITELTNLHTTVATVTTAPIIETAINEDNISSKLVGETTIQINETNENDETSVDDEVIDFGNADMGALANFLGE